MKIKINLQIFIFAVIFYLTKQIHIYTILMVFAFIHEIGHLIAGVLLGLKAKSINIMPFGLALYFEDYSNKYTLKKLIIAMAGPITNLIIALIGIYNTWNEDVIYANMLIGLFNLIPLYPLDGGRIFKCIIEQISNKHDAEKITYKLSNTLIIIFTIICFIGLVLIQNIGLILILIYL